MTKRVIKEIGLGTVIALFAFLGWKGYDIIPLIFIGGFFVALYFLAENKGLIKPAGLQEVTSGKMQGISFADIGGQDSAIKELKEALDFIKNQDIIKKLGIRPLKGILLTGPPGTGKTLMAKAAASYTDAVFVATSGSEFIEMYCTKGTVRYFPILTVFLPFSPAYVVF